MLVIRRWSNDRLSTDYLPRIDRLSTDSHQGPTIGHISTDTRSILDRRTIGTRWTVDRYVDRQIGRHPYMLHIISVKICSLYSKTSCKPYANVLKADRLSSVRWKDVLHVHYKDRVTVAAYRGIEEDSFDCNVNLKRCLIFSTLFEGSAFGVPSLHRFHLQCNYSIFSLLLYMLVVAVLTAFPSLCWAMFSLLRGFSASDEY